MCVTPLACGPQIADGTGDSFGGTETGGFTELVIPDGVETCVEMSPDAVTCWVGWGLVWARVLLPCTVSEQITAGSLGQGYDDTIEPWGPVVCHDYTAGARSCLYTEYNVLLTETVDGWLPEITGLVSSYPDVGPPCGETCAKGSEGCGCMLDGTCGLGLACNVGDVCEVCPPGSGGCFCYPDETCDPGFACTNFVCG